MKSYTAGLRDEWFIGACRCRLNEALIVFEFWQRHYNAVRPHGLLEYHLPALEAIIPSHYGSSVH